MGVLVKNGINYSGSIVDIPTPTTADAGKVLMVDSNGDWTFGTVNNSGRIMNILINESFEGSVEE